MLFVSKYLTNILWKEKKKKKTLIVVKSWTINYFVRHDIDILSLIRCDDMLVNLNLTLLILCVACLKLCHSIPLFMCEDTM